MFVVTYDDDDDDNEKWEYSLSVQTSERSTSIASSSPSQNARCTSASSFQDNAHHCAACAVIAAAATLRHNAERTGEQHLSSSMEEIEAAGSATSYFQRCDASNLTQIPQT
jgi:hypothetical protein